MSSLSRKYFGLESSPWLASMRLTIKSSLAGGFWLHMLFMILNNVIFWTIWSIFFQRFQDINGWRLPEVTLMYAASALAWGIKVIFLGGTRNLAQVIANGELDVWLMQPRAALPAIATSRSFPSGWGDIISGVGLALVSGLLTWANVAQFTLAIVCAAVIFVAAETILHCSAFWFGATNSLSRQLTEYIIMLSCNPPNIYRGWLMVLMYTVFPAALISLVPVEVAKGSAVALVVMIVAAGLFCGAATWLFKAGLQRYASGSTFVSRY